MCLAMGDELATVVSRRLRLLLTWGDKKTAAASQQTAPKNSATATKISYGTRLGEMNG